MSIAKLAYFQNKVTNGFWCAEHEKYLETTLMAVFDRFKETGRFDALKGGWKQGMPFRPHEFWESDVTKWLEGAIYFWKQYPSDVLLEKIDEVITDLEHTQKDDGYLNIYFTVVEPGERFKRRVMHELYCAGHMIEAGVAHFEATGSERLLNICLKYVDYIHRAFVVEKTAAFETPGHQEIELALLRLYSVTRDPMHLALARHFIDKRGHSAVDPTYDFADQEHMQSHLPVRSQFTAEGHSVRALYMYSSMVDLAVADDDSALLDVCFRLYDNIVRRRMAITGGVGSTPRGESFTFDYDLPEYTTYNETCASIALAMFVSRLWRVCPKSEYADIAEKALYNTVLAGGSLRGDAFFYENPLAFDPNRVAFNDSRSAGLKEHLPIGERVKVFGCSCCPPNLIRTVGSISEYAYTVEDNVVRTHMYMGCEAKLTLGGRDLEVRIAQTTDYPFAGDIAFDIDCDEACAFRFDLRIPTWCRDYEVRLNGAVVDVTVDSNGYCAVDREWHQGDQVTLSLAMPVVAYRSNNYVVDLVGRVAIQRGPIVYCLEAHDNEIDGSLRSVRVKVDELHDAEVQDVVIDGYRTRGIAVLGTYPEPCADLYSTEVGCDRDVTLHFIPYFTWANRGVCEMITWVLEG